MVSRVVDKDGMEPGHEGLLVLGVRVGLGAVWVSPRGARPRSLCRVAPQADKGENVDNSAAPIYLAQVRNLSAAFAKCGTLDAAARRLAVLSLWRPGEMGGTAVVDLLFGVAQPG